MIRGCFFCFFRRRALFRGGRWAGGFASAADGIAKLTTVTLLTVGAFYIFSGSLTVGALVSFYSLTAWFSTPLSDLVHLNESYAEARIAYERLFLDAFNGNHTLFVRDDEVRAAWAWIDSVADAWKAANLPMEPYPAGSWGPDQAHLFLPAAIVADNRMDNAL